MALPVVNLEINYLDVASDIKDFLEKSKYPMPHRSTRQSEGEDPMEALEEDDDAELEELAQNMDLEGTGLKYWDQLQRIANREQTKLVIELEDIVEFQNSHKLATDIKANAKRYHQLFCQVIDEIMPQPSVNISDKDDVIDVIIQQRRERNAQNAQEGIEMFPPALTRRYDLYFKPLKTDQYHSVRNVRGNALGKLITVRGIITRVSEVKPLLLVNAYSCESCEAEIFQEVDGRQVTPLETCISDTCKNNGTKGKLFMQTRACKFAPFQEVKIQEMADQVPVGHIPRSMTVHLYGNITRSVSPGDIVNLSGIFLPIPYSGFRGLRLGLQTDTYLEAQDVRQLKKQYNAMEITPALQQSLENLRRDDALYSKLASSIAPEIFGHDDVKKALLLLLVGGVTKETGDGMKIRGDLNICLMGDPGVAKSQLLKYISKVAPRGVYTTGRGSSGVGLTAAVMRDPVTDEMVLEGGALVLADNGIACIDEFDKMDEADRTAIHEVMEQQTISISKAGITTTLNARTSILAAANPLYGRYNPKISPVDNINLPAALLSRFDLLFLILDSPSRANDEQLAHHVTHVHMHNEHPTLEFEPVEPAVMRHYIALARQKRPVVTPEVSQYVVGAYVQLRKQQSEEEASNKFFSYTSARTLLAILRLSQALARLRFADYVQVADVDEALRLMVVSKSSLYDDDSKDMETDRTDISKIYRIIRDMAASGAGVETSRLGRPSRGVLRGNEDDDNDNDGDFNPTQLMREIRGRVIAKGFTESQLMNCVHEYEELNVWRMENKGTILRFVDDD